MAADREDLPDAGEATASDGPAGEPKEPGQEAGKAEDSGRAEEQFAGAAADPLADAFGGTAHGSADHAYRTWAQMVQPSGPVAVVGGGRIGSLHVGGTAIYMPGQPGQATGDVSGDVLDELRRRYVRVAGFGDMAALLAERHLAALRGVPGTGRAATALSLLAEAAGGQVSRFDPETDLRSLGADDFKEGTGYLLEVTPGGGNPVPTAVRMDWIAGLLARRGCFMIIVVPHGARYRAALSKYVRECPAPDGQAVLDRAIECAGQDRPEAAEAMRVLAADERIRGQARSLMPSGVLRLAGLIAAHAAGDVSFDELLLGTDDPLRGHVTEWFEPLADLRPGSESDDLVRLGAFRIALAVFHESPLDVILEAGELLAAEVLKTASPRRNPGRQVFVNRREDYVTDSRARLVPAITVFGRAGVTSTCAAYIDERTPAAVLRHVWDMHNVRGPLIAWLQSLCQDTRPFVWMRAALAIGLLSSWDFAYTFHQLIDPWASSPDEERGAQRLRLAAAVALDAAARNEDTLPVVRELIGDWCRKGSVERRWTGTAALGYDLGVRYAAKSLRDLRIAGCWQEGSLVQIASWSAMRIFARSGVEPVLQSLREWLYDSRRDVRALALITVARIAYLTVSDLDDLEPAGGRGLSHRAAEGERARWPLLVAMAAASPQLRDPLADIIWQMTRALPTQQVARDVLARWIRAAHHDRTCAAPVGRFLALVGDDSSDRARLLHLIGVMRRDPDRPLPADIASQLERAVELNIHAGNWEE